MALLYLFMLGLREQAASVAASESQRLTAIHVADQKSLADLSAANEKLIKERDAKAVRIESMKRSSEVLRKDMAELIDTSNEMIENDRKLLAAVEENQVAVAQEREIRLNLERSRAANLKRIAAAAASDPSPAAPDYSRISEVVEQHAKTYYGDGRRSGSGQSLVFDVKVSLEEPHEVPGWSGEYEVDGEAHYNFYDSIYGGTFSSSSGRFNAVVKLDGNRIKVTSFSQKL